LEGNALKAQLKLDFEMAKGTVALLLLLETSQRTLARAFCKFYNVVVMKTANGA
jgi:hypothetical protein